MSRVDTIAGAKRKRMAELENDYLKAQDYLKSDQFIKDQLKALGKVRSIVRNGTKEDGEALQIVGRVQQILLDTYEREDVIVEYDSLKNSLAEMFPPK